MVTAGIGVVDKPPAAVGIVYESAVALRPPRVGGGVGVDDGVVGRLLPRPLNAGGAGAYHHVAGGRAGSAALGRGEVVVAVVVEELGALQDDFGSRALGNPVAGYGPAAVNGAQGVGEGGALGVERRHAAEVNKQVALAVGSGYVARVYAAAARHLNGVGPGACYVCGCADVVLAL